MVVRNKLHRVIEKYRNYLKTKTKKGQGSKSSLKGNRTKNKVLNFYLKNNRWPYRKAVTKNERILGTKFENYLSKKSIGYDSKLRKIVFASGLRTSSNKTAHNVVERKKLIIAFIEKHGRTPVTHEGTEIIKGEKRLRSSLDYYTKRRNDMTLLGKVYSLDKCHLSGIKSKYRAIINDALNVEKPLIRLV